MNGLNIAAVLSMWLLLPVVIEPSPGDKKKNADYKGLSAGDRAKVGNGDFIGHGGFGGQWMAASPATGVSIAYFSTFSSQGVDTVRLTQDILAAVRRSSRA